MPSKAYKQAIAEEKRKKKAIAKAEKARIAFFKKKSKEAKKERERQEFLEKQRRKAEKDIAIAKSQEALARRRKARRAAVKEHPLARLSRVKVKPIKRRKGARPWYDLV